MPVVQRGGAAAAYANVLQTRDYASTPVGAVVLIGQREGHSTALGEHPYATQVFLLADV